MSGEMMLFPATVEEFMEQYKVVDRDHALSNGAEFVPVFRMRQWFDHLQAPPITNADRIRSSSDEWLAEWLAHLTDCVWCPCPDPHDQCDTVDGGCQKQWLNWLKAEGGDAQ